MAPPEGLCQGVDVHYEEKCLERDEVALYEDSFYRAKQGKCDRSRLCQAILFPGGGESVPADHNPESNPYFSI